MVKSFYNFAAMVKIMGIINLTPDSFWKESRCRPENISDAIKKILDEGADIIDIGAVSTRPGAEYVSEEEEWNRLKPALEALRGQNFSIDTVRSTIVKKVYEETGTFMVNDISAGEDDPQMLSTVAELGLSYVAMHKRGTPLSMDSKCEYPLGVVEELLQYFKDFSLKAKSLGVENWILDPGFGFAKTKEQNIELLERLQEFAVFEKPILVGIADKRFTEGDTEKYHRLALQNGASILRVHDVSAAVRTIQATL